MKIKCAIIGLGFWGKIFLEKISRSRDFELVAVSTRSNAQKGLGNIKIYPTAEELIAQSGAEFIFILTSLEKHLSLSEMALSANKNIFLTKPLTPKLADSIKLKKLAQKKSKKIFVDHTFLFNQDFLKFMTMTSSQKILNLSSLRTQFGRFQKGSDVLGELLYHDIYMSLALMSGHKPKAIKATGLKLHGQDLDQCALTIEFQNSAGSKVKVATTAELFASMNFIQKQKSMSVLTKDKIISWQDMAPSIMTEAKYKYGFGAEAELSSPQKTLRPWPPHKDAVEEMLKHIAACLHKGKESRLIGIDQGIEVMRIIEAARKSAQSGGKKVRI